MITCSHPAHVAVAFGSAVLVALAACEVERAGDDVEAPAPVPQTPQDPPSQPETPGTPPDPERFLPTLEGYQTDDEAETGDLEASFDHGGVPYDRVRRRLVLDDQGFTRAAVTVVTFDPDEEVAERYLAHRFGDAPRRPVEFGGVEMLRIDAEPFAVLAWIGAGFVVTFERGQEVDEAWLEELARASVAA